MIYVTGDTHGGFQQFITDHFPQQKQMGRDDYAIIAGDFASRVKGVSWWPRNCPRMRNMRRRSGTWKGPTGGWTAS